MSATRSSARIRNFDHICTDESNLVTLGTTSFGNTVEINRQVMEADRIILTGEIMYHLIAGYSGGRKSLAPGVAGWRTTTFNHRMIFDPRCASGILDGNPSHEDLLEACRMADPDFLVNVVLTPDGKLARVVAGHFELAHRAGCLVVDEVLSAEIGEPYDVLIASAGGYPLDIDLRQAHKGLENACRALKPGGSILFFAECPNGSGHPSFDDYVDALSRRYRDEGRRCMEHFEVGGHKAYWVARLGRVFDIHLVRRCRRISWSVAICIRSHRRRHAARLRELLRPGSRVGVIPHAGHTLPRVAVAAGGRTMMSRRSLVLGVPARRWARPSRTPGAQTNAWTIDPKNLNSLLQVLAAVKRLGFEGFETSFRNVQAQFDQAASGARRAEENRPAILRCPRFPAGIRSADRRSARGICCRTVADGGAALGAERLIVSGASTPDPAALSRKAKALDRAGRYCREKGMKFGYHNHDAEFRENGRQIEALLRDTDPALFHLILDAGHAQEGGANVAEFFTKHAGRIDGIHLRDARQGKEVPLGQGDYDWRPLAAAVTAREVGRLGAGGRGKTERREAGRGCRSSPPREAIRRVFGV